jgi:hypothetical protein
MFDNKPLQSASNAAKDVVLANLQGTTCLEILATLRKLDTHGLLERRGRYLAEVLHLVSNTLNLNPNEFTLYEVGAHHHRVCIMNHGPYNPGIAQFHALYKELLPYNYYAFDPDGSPVILNFETKQFLEGNHILSFTKKYPRPDKDFFEKFIKAIESISIPTFDKLKVAAEKTKLEEKIPVFFSNHVFNDPSLERDFPFWQLPGIHFHRVNFFEGLCKYGNAYEKEISAAFELLKQKPLLLPVHRQGEQLNFRRDIEESNLISNPNKQLDHFRRTFGIDAKVSHIYIQKAEELIYYWKS